MLAANENKTGQDMTGRTRQHTHTQAQEYGQRDLRGCTCCATDTEQKARDIQFFLFKYLYLIAMKYKYILAKLTKSCYRNDVLF